MRLGPGDNVGDILKKMSENEELEEDGVTKVKRYNPGAVSVMMELFKKDFYIATFAVAEFDKRGIYSNAIWDFYKDNDQDLGKMIKALNPDIPELAKTTSRWTDMYDVGFIE